MATTTSKEPERHATAASGAATPLSYAQLCFWFIAAALRETANVHLALDIEGELCIQNLERAIDEMVQRHEALRASIKSRKPVQVFEQVPHFDLGYLDLRRCDAAQIRATITGASRRMVEKPFDLSKPPLFRALLARIDERRHWLLMAFPHIVADGGAVYQLQRQLAAAYERLQQGRAGAPEDVGPRLSEHIASERERYHTHGARSERFWRERLAGHPYPRFAAEHLADEGSTRRNRIVELSEGAWTRLNERVRAHKATLQMGLVAAIGIAVARVTRQERFTLSSILENREQPATAGMVTPMLRVMPIPLALHSSASFAQALLMVKTHVLAAYDHNDCPWTVPIGILGEQRWRMSPWWVRTAIRIVSVLYATLFRDARLYGRYLADCLFMDPHPPRSLWELLTAGKENDSSIKVVPNPAININMLQSVFKREPPSDASRSVRVSYLKDSRQILFDATGDSWESDTINVHVTDSASGRPVIRISCCCLNDEGLSRLCAELATVLEAT